MTMRYVHYLVITLGLALSAACGGGGGGTAPTTDTAVDTTVPDDGPSIPDVDPDSDVAIEDVLDTSEVADPDADDDVITPDTVDGEQPDGDPTPDSTGDDTSSPDTVDPPDTELSCEEQENCAGKPSFAVCGIDDVTYPNDCYALCSGLGFDEYEPGPCAECPNCDEADKATGQMCDPVTNTTYDNLYEACCDGLTVSDIQPGACITENQCAQCPADYEPVCTKKADGTYKTYDNICQFEFCNTDGDVFSCGGPCGDANACPACAISSCNPVCGKDGQTHFNACYANCSGTQVDYPSPCCNCPPASPETYVCSTEGNTHGNICELNCKLEEYSYDGACIPGCQPTPDDPPDGTCGNLAGDFKIYFNEACATAAGATCIHEGPCSLDVSPCLETNTNYEPVCATVPSDIKMQTYPNACYAGCAGATAIQSGLCGDASDSDNCEIICAAATAQPHCATADCVLYPNKCIPEKCMGYSISSLMKNECDVNICPSAAP